MREPRNDIVHCAGLCPTTATIFVSRGHWADAHANTQGVYTSILEALYKTWDVHSFPLTAFKTNRCGLLRTFIVASSWLQLNCLRTINKNVFVTAELMQGSWRVATSESLKSSPSRKSHLCHQQSSTPNCWDGALQISTAASSTWCELRQEARRFFACRRVTWSTGWHVWKIGLLYTPQVASLIGTGW